MTIPFHHSSNNFNQAISDDFSWSVVACTDMGKVRKVNEDDYMANDKQAHWAVSDGMGGHEKGDVASQSISAKLKALEQQDELADFVDQIEDGLIDVNINLRKQAIADGDEDAIIGSTVAGLLLHQQQALYYWAGDSRIYRLRQGVLAQLSIDHTYTQELLQQGKLSAEQIANHPEKNIITRAIGADEQLFLDFEMITVWDGDLFLICSDGIEKEMTDSEVQTLLNEYRHDLKQAGQQMIDTILARNARDNATFILVAVNRK